VVPSEDYSHAPPCYAVFLSEGRQTETEPQSTKKKTMKTKPNQKSESGLKNRPEPLSTANRQQIDRVQIDFIRRRVNRSLDTAKLLSLLKSETPKFFELAEVVGKWVWIEFTEKQPAAVTRVLAELGFHWNKVRQAWQHPCGMYRDRSVNYDPRKRYGSYFAAAKPSLSR
jgi:hypothetical protein